jgi:hypothetical protein
MITRSRTNVYILGAFLAVVASACATAAPRADGPVFSPAGTTSTYEMRDSGSFGSTSKTVTNRSLGERTWRGKTYRALEIEQGTRLSDPVTGEWVAIVKGDAPFVTYEPPLGYNWPLTVGKSFVRKFRVTNHATKQTTDIEATIKVEAYEEVTVPAGTFKTFKMLYTDSTGFETINWYNPDGGGWVKIRSRRTSTHPLGPGTRELDLISRTSAR